MFDLMTEYNVTKEQLASICNVDIDSVRKWLNGERLITLRHLLPIVEHFNCSFNYILGKTLKFLEFIPQKCPPFHEHIDFVIKQCRKTKKNLKNDINIYYSFYTNWKKGKSPHVLTLIKIADYLGCTVDNLVGREKIE